MVLKIAVTKSNAIATKKSLDLANMGYGLLDQKRNVLIKEMMLLLDDVKEIRSKITETYNRGYSALQDANISLGLISNISESSPIDTGISIAYRSVMGVEIPKVIYNNENNRQMYPFDRSNSRVDYTYQCFQEVKELTILLAQVENSVYRLAVAISKTQKRANALVNVSIPNLEETYKMIMDSLEQKDREEFVRQKMIKTWNSNKK